MYFLDRDDMMKLSKELNHYLRIQERFKYTENLNISRCTQTEADPISIIREEYDGMFCTLKFT